MKLLLLLFSGLLFLAPAVHAERYIVNFAAGLSYTDQSGKIRTVPESKRAVLILAAQGEDPKDLELIYDTSADEIDVVKKSDGSVLSVRLKFTGGNQIENSNDTSRLRIALVSVEGAQASGSVQGHITLARNDQGALTKFLWHANFQAGVNSTLLSPEVIIKGSFATGKKFVPTNPPAES